MGSWSSIYRHFATALGTLALAAIVVAAIGANVRLNAGLIGLALAASAAYGAARTTWTRDEDVRNDGFVPREACPACGEDWRHLPIAGRCPTCQLPYDEGMVVWGERDLEGRYARFVAVGPEGVRLRTPAGAALIPYVEIRDVLIDDPPVLDLQTGERVPLQEALRDARQARYIRDEVRGRLRYFGAN